MDEEGAAATGCSSPKALFLFIQQLRDVFPGVSFDGSKALFADNMLDPAGILGGNLRIDAQRHQQIGNQGVALIDFVGNCLTGRQQGDGALGADGDISVFPEVFHGNADTGLGESQLIGNVDGTNRALLVVKDQDGFQIVFG